MKLSEFENWDRCASTLGSKVSDRSSEHPWLDLEEFICWGIVHSLRDSRTFSMFSYLVSEIAPVVAPYKIKKILSKNSIPYDPSVLGYFTEILSWSLDVKQIEPIFNMAREGQNTYFENFFQDDRFAKWGNFGKPMSESPSKYLNLKTLRNHPLIYSRFSGVKTVFSDVSYYLSNNDKASLYEIAKNTHNDYSSVHKAYSLMSVVGVRRMGDRY